jgi:ADP-heptose:LPS heptosyltransferase
MGVVTWGAERRGRGTAGRRVLAIGPGNMGDVLMSGPAVRALARDAEVVYLCGPLGVPAASLLPGVAHTEVAAPVRHGTETGGAERIALRQLVRRLRRLGCDEAFLFASTDESPLPFAQLARAAGVSRMAGPSDIAADDLLDVAIAPADRHDVETNLQIASAFGCELPSGDDGRLQICEADAAALPTLDEPYVVIHPGSATAIGGPPVGWWQRVVHLADGEGVRIVVTGGRGEMDFCAEMCVGARDAMSVAGLTDFAWLVHLLRGARAALCGSIGPVHAAAAAGTPVVSVVPQDALSRRREPWGVPHVVLPAHVSELSAEAAWTALSRLAAEGAAGIAPQCHERRRARCPARGRATG